MSNDVIYKYPLEIRNIQEIKIPKYAEILSITVQYNKIVLYAFVNIDVIEHYKKFEYYRINLAETGNYAGNFQRDNYTFAGTLILNEGDYVLHAFYRKIKETEVNPRHYTGE